MSATQSDGRRDRDAYANPPPPPKKPSLPDDTLTLEVGGHAFTGWEDVRIVRGIELFPSHFALRLTERLPGEPGLFPIAPGQTFRLRIGSDLVMSGYIDSYTSRVSARGHQVSVVGRSATADLIDCAAGVTSGNESAATMTYSAASLYQLASDLCKPFGIGVTEPDGEGEPLVSIGDGIPQFTVPHGATVYDILEPQARLRQMLMLDGTDGSLILAKVGTTKAASGLTLPGSCEEAEISFSKQDRYTIYLPISNPFDIARDVDAATGVHGSHYAPVRDDAAFEGQPRLDGAPRYRPHFVISDQPVYGYRLAESLAKWEKSRRFGRSQIFTGLVSAWRDSAGHLWTPNTLAPIEAPIMKLTGRTWIISQVAFLKGGQGTRTAITLMPPEAFQPEPSLFFAFDPQIAQAVSEDLRSRAPVDPKPAGGAP